MFHCRSDVRHLYSLLVRLHAGFSLRLYYHRLRRPVASCCVHWRLLIICLYNLSPLLTTFFSATCCPQPVISEDFPPVATTVETRPLALFPLHPFAFFPDIHITLAENRPGILLYRRTLTYNVRSNWATHNIHYGTNLRTDSRSCKYSTIVSYRFSIA